MIATAKFARENNIPYLGICLGLHVAVIEYARHVLGLPGAHSTEFDRDCEDPVIALITEWTTAEGEVEQRDENTDLGGTMRLGSYPCELAPGSLAAAVYGTALVHERHRHRFEFNQAYQPAIEAAGMRVSGCSPDGKFVEIAELPGHPWFLAVQFHPEFQSKPLRPHPLFAAFVEAGRRHRSARLHGATLQAEGR